VAKGVMSKIAVITDTHFGCRNESKVFADYFDLFFSNVFFPELERRGITHVIHLGDLVDRRKFVNFLAADRMFYSFVNRLKDKRLTIIPGNHDCPLRESLKSNAVEVLLGRHSNVKIITEPTFISGIGLLVPWICASNREQVQAAIAKAHYEKARAVMGHFEMTGFEMHRGDVSNTGMDPDAFYGFETVLSGHYHHKSDKLNIHYLGAPYEITWNDYDDVKGFHIFDPDTLELEFIRNPYRMHFKVDYDDRTEQTAPDFRELKGRMVKLIVHARTQSAKFETFVRELERSEPANVVIADDQLVKLENDAEEATTKDTLEVLIDCLDGLSDTVDKRRLRTFLTDLYQEASKVAA
jgi:DNA repair exonuclease SbcCD nuclease subunit